MKTLKVLIGCETSGEVRRAFLDQGHDAWSCDLLPSQDRKRLRFALADRADIALPGAIDKAIALVEGHVITVTEDGTLIIVSP